jgi:DNA transformation protein and related proteins
MDAASLQKLFEPFAAVTIKGMFGGRGVYADGLMFALQAGEKIYLKTDAISAPRFKAAGSDPFVFRSPMGPKETSYWLMPAAAAADVAALKEWCSLALEAARRIAAAKEGQGAKRPKTVKAPRSGATRAPARRGAAKKAAAKPSGRRGSSGRGRAK